MNFQELKAIGLANPKGKIVSNITKDFSKDCPNAGSWDGSDCTRDFITDIIHAATRLSSMPSYIIGRPDTINPLIENPYDGPLPNWATLIALFKDAGNLWDGPRFIHHDPAADPGIVLLVGTTGDVVYIDTR